MAKGSIAKEKIQNKIAEALGQDYIGEFNKKIYVWANENGERIQIAITLTCPKEPIEIPDNLVQDDGDWDFSDEPKAKTVAVTNAAPAEITEQEKQNIADLMARLGL
jgi:hypothetical protein